MPKLLPTLCKGTDRFRLSGSRLAVLLFLTVPLIGTLFISTAEEAQAETLWTSTLNIQSFGDYTRGCIGSSEEKSCAQAMTDNTFVIDGQTYTITALARYRHEAIVRCYERPCDANPGSQNSPHNIEYVPRVYVEVEPLLPGDVRDGLSIRLGSLDLPLNYWGRHWTDVYGLSGSNFIFPTYKLLPWETGESLSVSLRNDPVAPIWPRNLTARRGNQAVTLHWDPPYLNGGRAITRYEYRYRTTGEFPATWTAVPDGSDADTDAGNERSVRVSGLTNGTIYRFELRAVNSAGAGPEWGGRSGHSKRPADVGGPRGHDAGGQALSVHHLRLALQR